MRRNARLTPKITLGKCLRALVIVVLTGCLADYVAESVSKYRSGRIGLTTTEDPVWATEFPAIAVCSSGPEFAPASSYSTWIRKVKHDYLDRNGNGEVGA